MHRAALAVAVSMALMGCAGSGEGLDEEGRPIDTGPPPLGPTFASIQQNVFDPFCIRCHAGAAAPVGLRLDAASSYAMLVNAPSVEVPALRRVRPGDPDTSYLIQKLEGRAAVGARMPLNAPALPQATIDVVRQWIAQGAQRPVAAGVARKPALLEAVAPAADAILETVPREILVSSEQELNASLIHSGNFLLSRSGHDGSFEEGNEVSVEPLRFDVRSTSPTVIAITVPAEQWTADSYRLVVRGSDASSAADIAGALIDGDADGAAGGDFVLYFDIGRPQ